MLLHFGVETIQAEWTQAVVSIGTFDGVHLGHRDLLSRNVAAARERSWPSIVVTFDRNPASIVSPDEAPLAIASLNDNVRMISEIGVSMCVILEFSAALSRLSALQFYEKILAKRLKAGRMVVGHDFAFGNGRMGNSDWLAERIATEVVPPFLVDGVRVSSTLLRQRLEAGDVEAVAKMRSAPFEIPGVVVLGQQLGRTLGYPTVNIARSANQILPKDGVYAGFGVCQYGRFLAAISIGNRPTVNGTHRTVEAFLMDYPGHSLYGQAMTIGLTHRLRDELKFDSLDELKVAMANDVERVRALG
jgi:riboflavin kinase / FMN adenylyltransferase